MPGQEIHIPAERMKEVITRCAALFTVSEKSHLQSCHGCRAALERLVLDPPNRHSLTVPSELALSKRITRKITARHLAILSLLAAPWAGFLAIALKPSPRRMWAQRWPTITFVGLYQLALDRCVEIHGLEHIPTTGPVILAGNHLNKTANDAMLIGSKILLERGHLVKFVSQADPPGRVLQHFLRLMGETEGVILPIQKGGATTSTMIEFLRHPETFGRQQPILGI